MQRALVEFAARTRAVTRRSGLDAAALEACEALAEAGVDALVLKGVAVARMLYRRGEHRGYFDVDLLVSPRELAAAGIVLSTLEYRDVTTQGVENVAGVLHAQQWSRVVPEFGNLSVDLHWRLPGCESSAENVWSAPQQASHHDRSSAAGVYRPWTRRAWRFT